MNVATTDKLDRHAVFCAFFASSVDTRREGWVKGKDILSPWPNSLPPPLGQLYPYKA